LVGRTGHRSRFSKASNTRPKPEERERAVQFLSSQIPATVIFEDSKDLQDFGDALSVTLRALVLSDLLRGAEAKLWYDWQKFERIVKLSGRRYFQHQTP
jgi:hypothetical protein